MKVAIITGGSRNRFIGDSGANLMLADSLVAAGVFVETFFIEDFGLRNSSTWTQIKLPFKLAKMNWDDYDILDISYGFGWTLSLMYQILSLPNRPLIVARTHSLGHMLHRQRIVDSRLGHVKLSWKYPLYHGGYHLSEQKWALRLADVSLFFNNEDLNFAIDKLGVSKAKVQVTRNGLDSTLLKVDREETLLDKESPIGIAQIGTFANVKGIEYSVHAFHRILLKYPNVRIMFLGTGVAPASVYSRFEESLWERITVIQSYERHMLPDFLKGHQIQVFPSLAEAFGMTLVEGMACGLAPVASNIGGPRDIIKHEMNGLLIPLRDSQAIFEAIETLLGNRSLLDRLRVGAWQSAQEFRWDGIASDTIELYSSYLRLREDGLQCLK